ELNGKAITNLSPRKVTESGVGHIPQDRHKFGLVLDFPIGENIVLQTYYKKPYSKYKVLNYKEIYEKAEKLIQEYDVRTPSVYTKARALSGGNQ
ncbi:heme ABC transporter ATP-binding protein, partial [Planococcus sp. SIMBA_143]